MTTVLTLGGAWDVAAASIPQKLNGTITNGRTVTPVRYNAWDATFGAYDGCNRLDAALRQVPLTEDIIVLGHSYGSVASNLWIKTKAAISPVDPDRLQFILLGDSTRARNGVMRWGYGEPPSTSRYRVITAVVQYDMWADAPNVVNAPGYWDALANVQTGDSSPRIHGYGYDAITLDDPHQSYWSGNIEYKLFPSALPKAGLTRDRVEAAYDRIVKRSDRWA